jgi:menaquinone-dependent protoporphyrinogen IX oxidase
MKTIIVFDTKTGASQTCAEQLAQKLNADIADLRTGVPDIGDYDTIVIGGGIYGGRFTAPLRKFIKQNFSTLQAKNTAYYICCAEENGYEKYFVANIPQELLEKAAAAECLGYCVDLEKAQGFFIRLVTKLMKKAFESKGKPLYGIKEDQLELFAQKIKE